MGYHSPTKASAEGGRDVGFPFASRPLPIEEGRGCALVARGPGARRRGPNAIGAGFFVAAKDLGAMRQVAPPAIAGAGAALETERTTPKARSLWSSGAMTEADFMSRPEFRSAEYQGRLVADPGGLIRFDTGASAFALAKYDAASGRMVPDRDATLNAARFVDDLAFCRSIPGGDLLKCWALHQGIVIDLDQSESVKP